MMTMSNWEREMCACMCFICVCPSNRKWHVSMKKCGVSKCVRKFHFRHSGHWFIVHWQNSEKCEEFTDNYFSSPKCNTSHRYTHFNQYNSFTQQQIHQFFAVVVVRLFSNNNHILISLHFNNLFNYGYDFFFSSAKNDSFHFQLVQIKEPYFLFLELTGIDLTHVF